MAGRKATSVASPDSVVIPSIEISETIIPVVGISELIVHNWSEKAKQEMRDKQFKLAKQKREAKDPEADYQGAKYRDAQGRECVKAIAFKNAIVAAASFSSDVTKVSLRGALFVIGELLPIEFSEVHMREDMVKIGMGTADLRYRPGYSEWNVKVPIQYNRRVISLEQIVSLLNLAGFSIGICEWRPQRNGHYGRFQVDTTPRA